MNMKTISENGKNKKFILSLNPYEAKALFSLVSIVEGDEAFSARKFTKRMYDSLEGAFTDCENMDMYGTEMTETGVKFAEFKKVAAARKRIEARTKMIEKLATEQVNELKSLHKTYGDKD